MVRLFYLKYDPYFSIMVDDLSSNDISQKK